MNHRDFGTPGEFDSTLQQAIDDQSPDLVVLAGFMRILDRNRQNFWQNAEHPPSLLPKYPGINTHQRALDAGDREHSAAVHFVTEELDGGPLIAQGKILVNAGDTAELAARV